MRNVWNGLLMAIGRLRVINLAQVIGATALFTLTFIVLPTMLLSVRATAQIPTPVAERVAREELSLPIGPHLRRQERYSVVAAINEGASDASGQQRSVPGPASA